MAKSKPAETPRIELIPADALKLLDAGKIEAGGVCIAWPNDTEIAMVCLSNGIAYAAWQRVLRATIRDIDENIAILREDDDDEEN